MDDYIAELLSKGDDKNLILSSQLEALLDLRLQSNCTEKLVEAADVYYARQMQSMDAAAAAEKLQAMPEALVSRYVQNLVKTEDGKKVLDEYFSRRFASIVDDWTALDNLLQKVRAFGILKRYYDQIETKAWELFTNALEGNAENPVDTLTHYENVMSKLLTGDALADCIENAKDHYWNGVTFVNFSKDNSAIYQAMACNSERCEVFVKFSRILKCKLLDNGDIHDYFDLMDEFFEEYGESMNKSELNEVVDKVVDILQDQYPEVKTREPRLRTWSYIVAQVGRSPMKGRLIRAIHENIFDLRKHIPSTFNSDCDRLTNNVRNFHKDYEKTPRKSGGLIDAASTLYKLLIDECVDCDSIEYSIPLDIWLLIGGYNYGSGQTCRSGHGSC